MKKVIVLLIVAVAVGVGGFFVVRDYFEKTSLRVRCAELGGLVCQSGDTARTPLEREWWHPDMPASADQYPPGEEGYTRGEWLEAWKKENEEHGGQSVTRTCAGEDVIFEEKIRSGPFAGGWRITFTWHLGVPGSDWGERITYKSIWVYYEQFWRVVRLDEVARNSNVGPPKAD